MARHNRHDGICHYSYKVTTLGQRYKTAVVEAMNSKVWAFIFSAAIIAPIVWMALDRDPPYERISGRILPDNPAPGDFIAVEWDIKVNRSCLPATRRNVTRRIIDSTGKQHDYEAVEGIYGTVNPPPPGIQRGFQLSPFIASGPARYHSIACFRCNPLQEFWPVCVDRPDINFNIAPPRD